MSRRLKVLYLQHPNPGLASPWNEDTIAALEPRHDLHIFDRNQPAQPQFEDVEVVVDLGGNITTELLEVAAGAGVKFIQLQTSGLDHVNVSEILATGMLLAHCPGLMSKVALAESAMMFILMLSHRWLEARHNFDAEKIYQPTGMELIGCNLGIIGLGASGCELARRAKPFGMRIMTIDIRPIEPDVLDEIQPDFIGTSDDLDHVIAESDFLSLHLHLNETTHHILDARRIGLMKSTAFLINVARGELADEGALYEALLQGRIGGAGLDAFAQEPPDPTLPVYQLPNVVVTPHTAGCTDGTSRKRAQHAADNLDCFARGEPLVGQVSGQVVGA